MRQLLFLLMVMPMLAKGQVSNITIERSSVRGIRWTEGLSWSQVKEKAKQDNKYIFLDCFTTWCGPCKRMDKEIYSNDTIGVYFNERFISVKVQMDKTNKDNEQVKSWYQSAREIAVQYKVKAFPTYVFLTPAGNIVHIDNSYKNVKDFIAIAELAVKPGKVYDNPYTEYDQAVIEFREGKNDYSRMPYLFKKAVDLRQNDFAHQVLNEYTKHLLTLKEDGLYDKETIGLLAHSQFILSSQSKFFHLFYPNPKRVNTLMNENGYAQKVIDRLIQREEVDPVIKINSSSMRVMYVNPKDIPPPPSEPNWQELTKKIRKKYNAEYAKRNVFDAKIKWYQSYHCLQKLLKYYFMRIEKYGMDTTNVNEELWVNHWSWEVFEKINDRSMLNKAIKQMQGLVRRSVYYHPNFHGICIDTYANLLYKIGRRNEAIEWEGKAVNHAINFKLMQQKIDTFSAYLKKMKNGEPTWPVNSKLD